MNKEQLEEEIGYLNTMIALALGVQDADLMNYLIEKLDKTREALEKAE